MTIESVLVSTVVLNTADKMTSVEDVFRPAFEEINRRATAVREGGAVSCTETTHFSRDGSEPCHVPYVIPGQDFALVTMGTNVLAPRPVDQLRPALRVYGSFATKEDAADHASAVTSLDPACSLVVVPMREWFIFPQTEECRDDLDVRKKRSERRLQSWRTKQAEDGDAFERRVKERLQPDDAGDEGAAKRFEEEEDGTTEAEDLIYRPPKRLARTGAEVRGHVYVALSVIPDDVVGECLVKLHGFHETAQDADTWSRNVASRTITDDDIFVAPACEWLYPNGDTKNTTHYRNDELQRIMDAADRNPQAVEDYKTWKAEQDRQRAIEETEEAIEETDAVEEDE
jgi:hypothetical protein